MVNTHNARSRIYIIVFDWSKCSDSPLFNAFKRLNVVAQPKNKDPNICISYDQVSYNNDDHHFRRLRKYVSSK